MPKRMLIDASHPEETRVVVLDGQKVEEFDFEAASKRPLKGNIYLAKVTRVEPSLQAAFVEYGGNRQGFLAFSEIHPDYYQIPVADRQALLAEQEAEARRRADEEIESFDIAPGPKPEIADDEAEEIVVEEDMAAPSDLAEQGVVDTQAASQDEEIFENQAAHDDDEHHDADAAQDAIEGAPETPEPADEHEHVEGEEHSSPEATAETVSEHGESAKPLQAQRPPQRFLRKRHYKIQEVIKRRQIILVQVVKEERGNKGAALTTYLSLAGRYCVLMPNTPRGGGISRKITNANDRKRLKSAAQALELPEGMGLIIRTAGESRTKVEIKRDYEYLLRTWDAIRELTLQSNAPARVYEEGDLVKRAIRDLYNKDVGEIIVEGDEGYRNAKDFMRMLMPSHAKNVKLYKEPVPLFQRHHIEAQLDAMFSSTVTLKSGGYIVINQTEALVSIDVNSGRATREHSIEETARKTNLEAADEIGRQLRLRDLAGLIVIDFIDMEDGRNDRDVEKRMRDAVKNDRARVQIGKISQFGLLEMSRQRLRAGVIAGSTVPCPHCGGQGIVRSVESTALRLLRGLEEEGQKLKASAVVVRIASDVAIYTLNQKRRELARIENDYQMTITFEPKEGLMVGTFEIERTAQKSPEESAKLAAAFKTEFVPPPAEEEPEEIVEEIEAEEEEETAEEAPRESGQPQQQQGSSSKRRRRRRGGRGHGSGDRPPQQPSQQQPQPHHPPTEQPVAANEGENVPAPLVDESESLAQAAIQAADGQNGAAPRRKRRRRRGKRGGSGRSENGQHEHADGNGEHLAAEDDAVPTYREDIVAPEPEPVALPNGASSPVWSLSSSEQGEIVSRAPETIAEPVEEPALETADAPEPDRPSQPAKKGWWQRTFRSE
ncbi:MAG TPA: ribonuclease E/G [Rhizomicrobium sp.]|nr:ribonuclease E/G [Rhizomicrobium sp.]